MSPLPFTPLVSPRLRLRHLQARDAPALHAYRSLPEVSRYQSWSSFDAADVSRLIADQADRMPNTPGTWFQLALVDAASDRLVGDCGLHCLQQDPRQIEIGISLSPLWQGAGLATEALHRVLAYLFDECAMHRVVAVTDAENHAAARLFRRLGFRLEGHFVERVLFKGAYGSEYLFALLRREWVARIATA